MKDFRSETGLHKIKTGLFDISALDCEEGRRELMPDGYSKYIGLEKPYS